MLMLKGLLRLLLVMLMDPLIASPLVRPGIVEEVVVPENCNVAARPATEAKVARIRRRHEEDIPLTLTIVVSRMANIWRVIVLVVPENEMAAESLCSQPPFIPTGK
jgi:hypothetical protein